MVLQVNPDLDRAALAAAFARDRRVRIPDLLTLAAADRLHACLSRETPWLYAWNEGDRVRLTPRADMAALPPAEQQALQRGILHRARGGFQFMYYSYPMLSAYREGRDPDLFLHRLFEFLNSPPMLDLVRGVTGIGEIVKGDAQATFYAPGHFLTLHDDGGQPEEHRRVAYVLSLTRGWRADWGGLLQFHGPDGDVVEGWAPRYNSLALFEVPVPHSVSAVAHYAGAPRLSVTGWWRDG